MLITLWLSLFYEYELTLKKIKTSFSLIRGCPRGVIVKAMDFGIAVSEFILQSRYYIYFRANTLGKDMNPLILLAMGYIVPLPFFYENGFDIK